MEILSDPTPDTLAMPRFDDGAIDMRELLRRLAEQVMNAVMAVVAEMYATGTSTRKVQMVAEKVGVSRLSKDQVSAIALSLEADIEDLCARPLGGSPAPYVKCRREGRVASTAEVTHGAWRDGSTAAGFPRWRCRCCGRRFTSLTGTVLEHCRKPLPAWVSFIRPMRHNVPVECAAELCGVTHKTAFEWRHRVLARVSGYQDRIVLRDTVWVDETYINNTDLSKGYGQARKRGLSRQKLCICVVIDVHKNPVAVVCGHGKPSSARMRKAMGGRIAPGSLLIHDL